MKHNQRIGKWGEDAVAAYLAERGYEIIARNARTPYGEIDIVAKQGDITIFVEVKTLTSSKNFFPEQNVTARKQNTCSPAPNTMRRKMQSITGRSM